MMTVDEIMEQIRDGGGLDHWCEGCPEKVTFPGHWSNRTMRIVHAVSRSAMVIAS